MSAFVEGVKSLFTGGGSGELDALKAAAEKSRKDSEAALNQQRQQQQAQQAEADLAAGRAARVPRGRRLLLAATGEAGLSDKLGG